MDQESHKAANIKGNTVLYPVWRIIKIFLRIKEESLSNSKLDARSNGHIVKKRLRCAISGCFDMDTICCKECNIKKCMYKCNFIDREVCEHQLE